MFLEIRLERIYEAFNKYFLIGLDVLLKHPQVSLRATLLYLAIFVILQTACAVVLYWVSLSARNHTLNGVKKTLYFPAMNDKIC